MLAPARSPMATACSAFKGQLRKMVLPDDILWPLESKSGHACSQKCQGINTLQR